MAARSNNDPGEHAALRPVSMEYLSGRALYERVLRDGVARANVSVWIATANLKELRVEPPAGLRVTARDAYISIMEVFAWLVSRGVEIRLLHAGLPSGAFARELMKHRSLLRVRSDSDAGLQLRRCPRVHLKTVVIDGSTGYLGSANWTGAGLGAKGAGRRNFEVGFVTHDEIVLDDIQALYERIWTGAMCKSCGLRDACPQPIDQLDGTVTNNQHKTTSQPRARRAR